MCDGRVVVGDDVAHVSQMCCCGSYRIDDAARARPLGNQSVMRLPGVHDNKHLRI